MLGANERCRRTERRRGWMVLAAIALMGAVGSAHAEYHCMPGTPIPGNLNATATVNINIAGCYFLAGNRRKINGGPVIQINVSHVYLDLRGKTLTHIITGDTIITNAATPITDVHVTNGKLTGAPGGFGVYFTNVPDGVFNVSDLVIADAGLGAPAFGIVIGLNSPARAHAVVARNIIDFYDTGILFENVSGGRIENNVLQWRLVPPLPTAAILLRNSVSNDVRDNTATIAVNQTVGNGIRVDTFSHYNNIRNNTVSGWFDGIYVNGSDCNSIDWNIARGNLNSGIYLDTATNNNIYSFNRTGNCIPGSAAIIDLGTNTNVQWNMGTNF